MGIKGRFVVFYIMVLTMLNIRIVNMSVIALKFSNLLSVISFSQKYLLVANPLHNPVI